MYKQHPGTAPTYVNYGAPTFTPQVASFACSGYAGPRCCTSGRAHDGSSGDSQRPSATPARRKAAPIRLSTGTSGR